MLHCAVVSYSVTVVVGVAMIVTGIVVLDLVIPPTLKKTIEESLVLKESSNETVQRFVESRVPSYIAFTLFSVTNKDEVNANPEIQPVLEEVGPFVFRQKKVKNILNWDEKFGTVSYKERTRYFFEPTMSKDIEQKINHFNVVSLGMVLQFRSTWDSIAPLLPMFDETAHIKKFEDLVEMINGNYIETHTAEELLFKGFSIEEYLPKLSFIVAIQCSLGCLFGYYEKQNKTTDEPLYEVSTGFRSMKDFGVVMKYEGKTTLDYWPSPCNHINGTDGVQFPPGVTEDDQLYVFSSDVCRSLKLKYEKEITIEGIDALRFIVPDEVFADPNVNKDNMCFCPTAKDDKCPLKAGMVPLSKCKEGQPIMASAPHFYQGDKEYYEAFKNLNPQKVNHQTYIDIEPLTGTVISAAKRIQINIDVQPHPGLKFMANRKPTYFPAFWLKEGGEIDSNTAKEFRDKVYKPYRTGKWSMVAIIILGGIALLIVGILILVKKPHSSSRSFKIGNSSKAKQLW